MNTQQIIESLAYFGFEDIDSKVYMGLLQTGPVSVGSLSSRLGIDRGKTYRSLSKLRNLGVVSTTFSNPTLCSAIEPIEALTTILERKQDEIVTMKSLSEKISQDISEIVKNCDVQEISSFLIIQGRSNIYSRIGKILQKASGTVYIVAPQEDLMRMYHTTIPERIQLIKENGVEVRILTESVSEKELSFISRLNPSEIRTGKLPSKSRMVVEENKQLIMSGSLNGSMDLNDDGDSVMHTNSIEMVNNMYSLCTLLWNKSKEIEVVIPQRVKRVKSQ
ncbi:TrmB family transcriptional regulator [Candidatus Nitrosotenuis chungbukensis]|uniref:TrmB family transcriptional regulator n=1 Tax=Candidatus Nitrosotenuis chungbukensis TaxID=1353246 RepID=UPI0006948009|nr:helix-turn-helix domain-containing protein [Candidatus Nitrosotenuis chungbukensis]